MVQSTAYLNDGKTALDKIVKRHPGYHPDKTGAILLSDGIDAFVARAALSMAAKKSLDIQYYIFNDDQIGQLLASILLDAGDRGVRIRLLLDDMNQRAKDQNLLALASHPNIHVRIFNPFARNVNNSVQLVTRFGDVTRRMHNKMFIADNSMGVIGGRNIGDAYFDTNPDHAFSDLDALLAGKVVGEASNVFDIYWNSDVVYPIEYLSKQSNNSNSIETVRHLLKQAVTQASNLPYLNALKLSSLGRDFTNEQLQFQWLDANILFDNPIKVTNNRDKKQLHLSRKIEPYFAATEAELLIITPYFVPGKQGVKFLSQLRDKGVKITIITNSLASNDVSAVHAGYSRYRKALLALGISLYEIKPKTTVNIDRGGSPSYFGSFKTALHAKSIVFDKTHIFIGSFNFDPRSAYENTEVGTILTAKPLAQKMVSSIEQNINSLAFKVSLDDDQVIWTEAKDGQEIIHDTEPYTTWLQRLGVSLMKLLPIESQL